MGTDQKQCNYCGVWKPIPQMREGRRQCKDCRRAYHRQYQQTDKYKKQRSKYKQLPEVKERNREYDRRPDIKKRRQEYNQRPEVRERARKWMFEYRKEYQKRPGVRERNREYQRLYIRNRKARQLSLPNTFADVEWQHALNYFNGCCAVCGRQMNDMFGEFTAAMDHWIPLSYEGSDNPGTVAANIIPLCHGVSGCNNKKKAATPNVWLEQQFGKRKAKKIVAKVQAYFDSLV